MQNASSNQARTSFAIGRRPHKPTNYQVQRLTTHDSQLKNSLTAYNRRNFVAIGLQPSKKNRVYVPGARLMPWLAVTENVQMGLGPSRDQVGNYPGKTGWDLVGGRCKEGF